MTDYEADVWALLGEIFGLTPRQTAIAYVALKRIRVTSEATR